MKNYIVDPATGAPKWLVASQDKSAKATFALETASLILSGKKTIEDIERDIIEAENEQQQKSGSFRSVETLKQVQDANGTAYMWFQELKRVSADRTSLLQLIEQKGNGLTVLYRRLGPSQAQRSKGFSNRDITDSIRRIQSTVIDIQNEMKGIPEQAILSEMTDDLTKIEQQLIGTYLKLINKLLLP